MKLEPLSCSVCFLRRSFDVGRHTPSVYHFEVSQFCLLTFCSFYFQYHNIWKGRDFVAKIETFIVKVETFVVLGFVGVE